MPEADAPITDQTVFSSVVPDKFAVQGDPVPPGTTLNGIYVVDERIARGGMGEVFAGRNIQTGHKVAIKMILPEHAQDELIINLFRREADVLHGVHHEAIVRYFLFSVDPG
ncbi:MAG: protein kinase, partial [Pseudomonadota bacterium]